MMLVAVFGLLPSCGRTPIELSIHDNKSQQLNSIRESYGSQSTNLAAKAYLSLKPINGDRVSVSLRFDIDLAGNTRIRVDKGKAVADILWQADDSFTMLLFLDHDVAVVDDAVQLQAMLHPEQAATNSDHQMIALLLMQIPALIDVIRHGPIPQPQPDEWVENTPQWRVNDTLTSDAILVQDTVTQRRWFIHENAQSPHSPQNSTSATSAVTPTPILAVKLSNELVMAGLRRPQRWAFTWHDGSTARIKLSKWGSRQRGSQPQHQLEIPNNFRLYNLQTFMNSLEPPATHTDHPRTPSRDNEHAQPTE